jgi:hypothetical protein
VNVSTEVWFRSFRIHTRLSDTACGNNKKDDRLAGGGRGIAFKLDKSMTFLFQPKQIWFNLGRELLRNPYWTLKAAKELECEIEMAETVRKGKIQII